MIKLETTWERKNEHGIPCLVFNDCRKVVKYGEKWFAFFRPDGWSNFGNSCEIEPYNGKSKSYKEVRQAMIVALNHFKKYGKKAKMNERL